MCEHLYLLPTGCQQRPPWVLPFHQGSLIVMYAMGPTIPVLLAPSGWATLCPSVCSVCPSVKPGVLGSPYSSWTHLSWCYFCLCHDCAHHDPLSPLLLLPPLRLWPLLLAPLPRLAGSRLCQGMSLQSPLPSLDSTARGNPMSMNISCA